MLLDVRSRYGHPQLISPTPPLTWCNLPFPAISRKPLRLQKRPFYFLTLMEELGDDFLKPTLGAAELHTMGTTQGFQLSQRLPFRDPATTLREPRRSRSLRERALFEIGRDLRLMPAPPVGTRGEEKGKGKVVGTPLAPRPGGAAAASTTNDDRGMDWSDEYDSDVGSDASRLTTPTPSAAPAVGRHARRTGSPGPALDTGRDMSAYQLQRDWRSSEISCGTCMMNYLVDDRPDATVPSGQILARATLTELGGGCSVARALNAPLLLLPNHPGGAHGGLRRLLDRRPLAISWGDSGESPLLVLPRCGWGGWWRRWQGCRSLSSRRPLLGSRYPCRAWLCLGAGRSNPCGHGRLAQRVGAATIS